jgi:hypothetical protein
MGKAVSSSVRHRVGAADHGGNRLALEAGFAFRKDRLIGKGRDHAEGWRARNVVSRHHRNDGRFVAFRKAVRSSPDLEACMMIVANGSP